MIASENDREDFEDHCRRLPEDAAPEVGTLAPKATTGPRTLTVRQEGRSFLAKIFCSRTGSESTADIEAVSARSDTSGKW